MKGRSERVPGKNLRPLCGKPLFHWILEALNSSGVVDEIIINTDSTEIAQNAQDHFNVTIHMRPDYLLRIQNDEANQIMAYDLRRTEGDYFLQTHSTNPLLTPETIYAATKTFFDNNSHYDSLFTVNSVKKRLYNADGTAINHDPRKLIKTQELPPTYEENSCIYIFSRHSFMACSNRIGRRAYMFPMKRVEAVDIDEEFDFSFADAIMRTRNPTS